MSNSNAHIKAFLNDYLNGASVPDYAVLITGDWGSGKTTFIREYLGGGNVFEVKNSFKNEVEYWVVYASLFGAKSREDMDQRVLQNLHPFLHSKRLNLIPKAIPLVGSLISIVALCNGAPLDATSMSPVLIAKIQEYIKSGKTDGIKEIEDIGLEFSSTIIEYLKNKEKKLKKVVVVFDDVERADLPIPELLGYLNEYVEHLHVPCILLADRKQWEIARKCQLSDSTLHKLSSTQEKVIGKIFQLQTTLDDVWTRWEYEQPVGNRAWEIIRKHKDIIARIFQLSKVKNFRSLKHSFLDFQRFIGQKEDEGRMFIKDEYLNEPGFSELLIADFFCFQYSYHIGFISSNDFPEENKSDKLSGSYKKFVEMFKSIDRISALPDVKTASFEETYLQDWQKVWNDWLLNNYVESEKIEKLICNSIWFNQKRSFNLLQLRNYESLNDVEADKCIKEFDKILYKEKEITPSELYTIYYYITTYADKGYWNENVNTVDGKMRQWLGAIDFKSTELLPLKQFQTEKKELFYIQKNFYAELARKIEFKPEPKDEKNIKRFFDSFDNEKDFKQSCLHFISAVSCPLWKIDIDGLLNHYRKASNDKRNLLHNSIKKHFEALLKDQYRKSNLKNGIDYIQKVKNEIDELIKKTERPYKPSIIALIRFREFLDSMDLASNTKINREKHPQKSSHNKIRVQKKHKI